VEGRTIRRCARMNRCLKIASYEDSRGARECAECATAAGAYRPTLRRIAMNAWSASDRRLEILRNKFGAIGGSG
jgi:hypothetical protein